MKRTTSINALSFDELKNEVRERVLHISGTKEYLRLSLIAHLMNENIGGNNEGKNIFSRCVTG